MRIIRTTTSQLELSWSAITDTPRALHRLLGNVLVAADCAGVADDAVSIDTADSRSTISFTTTEIDVPRKPGMSAWNPKELAAAGTDLTGVETATVEYAVLGASTAADLIEVLSVIQVEMTAAGFLTPGPGDIAFSVQDDLPTYAVSVTHVVDPTQLHKSIAESPLRSLPESDPQPTCDATVTSDPACTDKAAKPEPKRPAAKRAARTKTVVTESSSAVGEVAATTPEYPTTEAEEASTPAVETPAVEDDAAPDVVPPDVADDVVPDVAPNVAGDVVLDVAPDVAPDVAQPAAHTDEQVDGTPVETVPEVDPADAPVVDPPATGPAASAEPVPVVPAPVPPAVSFDLDEPVDPESIPPELDAPEPATPDDPGLPQVEVTALQEPASENSGGGSRRAAAPTRSRSFSAATPGRGSTNGGPIALTEDDIF